MSSIVPTTVTEGTPLLENDEEVNDDEEEIPWPHPIKHHHTSNYCDHNPLTYQLTNDVIQRTNIIFQPDFVVHHASQSRTSTSSVDAVADDNGDDNEDDDDEDTSVSLTIGFTDHSNSSVRHDNALRNYDNKRTSFSIRDSIATTATVTDNDTNIINTHSKRGGGKGVVTDNTITEMIGTVTTTSVLNLVVATAGGIGMVTLPGSFAKVGWLEGTLLLFVSAVAASFSLYLLNWACKSVIALKEQEEHKNNQQKQINNHLIAAFELGTTSSYASLVAYTLGNFGSQTLELLTLTYCVGQVIAYLGAIGGQVSSLLTLINVQVSVNDCIGVVALFVMFPLSLIPEESSLRFAGLIGTICMVYIVLAVLLGDGIDAIRKGSGSFCSLAKIDTTAENTDIVEPMAFASSFVTLLQNAPIFLFSMNACVTYVPIRYQHVTCLGQLLYSTSNWSTIRTNSHSNYQNMDHNGIVKLIRHELMKMILTGITGAAIFYLACSGVAYFAYCGNVPENVVDAWSMTWVPGLFARAFLAMELVMAGAGIYIPLGRAALWHLLYGPYETVAAQGVTRTIITFLFICVGAVGSIAVGGALALPLAITSALCVTTQMFILPGLCVNELLQEKNSGSRTTASTSIPGGRFTAIGFVVLGTAFGALSLAALFGLL